MHGGGRPTLSSNERGVHCLQDFGTCHITQNPASKADVASDHDSARSRQLPAQVSCAEPAPHLVQNLRHQHPAAAASSPASSVQGRHATIPFLGLQIHMAKAARRAQSSSCALSKEKGLNTIPAQIKRRGGQEKGGGGGEGFGVQGDYSSFMNRPRYNRTVTGR